MKLHLDQANGEYRISGYGENAIVVNDETHNGAIIVRVDEAPEPWVVTDNQTLDANAIEQLLTLRPEVLLIGTGARQQFPPVETLAALYSASVGFEVMDTRAACRTFNILAGEGRTVVAALLPIDQP